jgi:hypothetical protein
MGGSFCCGIGKALRGGSSAGGESATRARGGRRGSEYPTSVGASVRRDVGVRSASAADAARMFWSELLLRVRSLVESPLAMEARRGRRVEPEAADMRGKAPARGAAGRAAARREGWSRCCLAEVFRRDRAAGRG